MNEEFINEGLKNALNYDSLAEAEKITGKYSGTDDPTIFLGMAIGLDHIKHKSELLKAGNDTGVLGQTWSEALHIIEDLGFVKVHEHAIKDTNDVFCVFWHNDGVLMRAESYNNNRVNNLEIYLFWEGNVRDLPPCTCGNVAGDVWHVSKDVRDGLRFYLNGFETNGRIQKQWLKKPLLWLVDYMQKNEKGFDYKAITRNVLDGLPLEIQQAICHINFAN